MVIADWPEEAPNKSAVPSGSALNRRRRPTAHSGQIPVVRPVRESPTRRIGPHFSHHPSKLPGRIHRGRAAKLAVAFPRPPRDDTRDAGGVGSWLPPAHDWEPRGFRFPYAFLSLGPVWVPCRSGSWTILSGEAATPRPFGRNPDPAR